MISFAATSTFATSKVFFSFDLRNVFWNGKLVHEIKTILKSLKNFRSHEQFFRHAQVPSRDRLSIKTFDLLNYFRKVSIT